MGNGRGVFRCWLLLGVLGACVAGSALSAGQAAARMPGASAISTGLTDDETFVNPDLSESSRNAWMARANQVQTGWVRLGVYWQFIAYTKPAHPTDPNDPAYAWWWIDPAVRDAAAHHLKILLQVGYPPSWALGSNRPAGIFGSAWKPDVTAFGQFARLVAQRYSGRFPDPLHPGRKLPRVTFFQVWNEPNLPTNLNPQWTKDRHGHWVPYSAYLYRSLLNTGYSNIKAIQPHSTVLMAGLGPYGDPAGVNRMRPVEFMRELLCLRGTHLRPERCPNPAHFDGIDDHPYSLLPTTHASNRDDVSVPDLGRLTHVVKVALRKHRLFPRRRKSLWETEIFWTSNPPDPNGIPLLTQARRLSQAFYVLWAEGVRYIFWYLIKDYPYKSETGAGLYYGSGNPKLAATAFRFPFVATRSRNGVATIWGRAPRAGKVTIVRGNGHGWSRMFTLRTTKGGIFYSRRRLAPNLLLRAQIGSYASISWPGA